MPRLVFGSFQELLDFVKRFITKPENYLIIQTEEDGEIIVHQTVSTRPIFVLYYKCRPQEKPDELVDQLRMAVRSSVVKVQRVEWDIEKFPGVKVGP